MEEIILEELSKKYNTKVRVVNIMFQKAREVNYTLEDFKKMLNTFYCY